MVVHDCANYDSEFPEKFPWGHLDSPKLASIASAIVNRINYDLHHTERESVPGLREALRIISRQAEV